LSKAIPDTVPRVDPKLPPICSQGGSPQLHVVAGTGKPPALVTVAATDPVRLAGGEGSGLTGVNEIVRPSADKDGAAGIGWLPLLRVTPLIVEAAIGSENVTEMGVPTFTSCAPAAGERLTIVGAVWFPPPSEWLPPPVEEELHPATRRLIRTPTSVDVFIALDLSREGAGHSLLHSPTL
jgi:hypothetical protein